MRSSSTLSRTTFHASMRASLACLAIVHGQAPEPVPRTVQIIPKRAVELPPSLEMIYIGSDLIDFMKSQVLKAVSCWHEVPSSRLSTPQLSYFVQDIIVGGQCDTVECVVLLEYINRAFVSMIQCRRVPKATRFRWSCEGFLMTALMLTKRHVYYGLPGLMRWFTVHGPGFSRRMIRAMEQEFRGLLSHTFPVSKAQLTYRHRQLMSICGPHLCTPGQVDAVPTYALHSNPSVSFMNPTILGIASRSTPETHAAYEPNSPPTFDEERVGRSSPAPSLTPMQSMPSSPSTASLDSPVFMPDVPHESEKLDMSPSLATIHDSEAQMVATFSPEAFPLEYTSTLRARSSSLQDADGFMTFALPAFLNLEVDGESHMTSEYALEGPYHTKRKSLLSLLPLPGSFTESSPNHSSPPYASSSTSPSTEPVSPLRTSPSRVSSSPIIAPIFSANSIWKFDLTTLGESPAW